MCKYGVKCIKYETTNMKVCSKGIYYLYHSVEGIKSIDKAISFIFFKIFLALFLYCLSYKKLSLVSPETHDYFITIMSGKLNLMLLKLVMFDQFRL